MIISINRLFSAKMINFLKPYSISNIQQHFVSSQLMEVGHFEAPKIRANESYGPGQLFIHKLFAYRGIILFPWHARVLDRDTIEVDILELIGSRKRRFNTRRYYYQVLIDIRDRAFLRYFKQFEAVTYLGSANTEKGIFSIPGLDYVAHEDILPFTSNDSQPIQHELFESFFDSKPENSSTVFSGNRTLEAWVQKHFPWLDLSQVYVLTTEGIRVTAIPYYIGYQKTETGKCYWWRYQMLLENHSKFQVQLRSHHWRIFSSLGLVAKAEGPGVVGLEPFLCKRFPAFQYNSHIKLDSPKGHMWGTYIMEKENGQIFECHIPLFILESKDDEVIFQ